MAMYQKLTIFDSAENSDSYGAPVNTSEPDTTIPPAHPSKLASHSPDQSSENTRAPTPEEAAGLPKVNEKVQ